MQPLLLTKLRESYKLWKIVCNGSKISLPFSVFPKIFWGLNLNLWGEIIIQKGPEFLLITPTKELNLFITKKKARKVCKQSASKWDFFVLVHMCIYTYNHYNYVGLYTSIYFTCKDLRSKRKDLIKPLRNVSGGQYKWEFRGRLFRVATMCPTDSWRILLSFDELIRLYLPLPIQNISCLFEVNFNKFLT